MNSNINSSNDNNDNSSGENPQTPSSTGAETKPTTTVIDRTTTAGGTGIHTVYDDGTMTTTIVQQPRHCYNVIEKLFSPQVHEFVYNKKNIYNIALLINDCITCHDLAISAISHPISTCHAVSLIVLNPMATTTTTNEDDTDTEAKQWLEKNSINADTTQILYGHDGFRQVLNDTAIDTIYIFVPATLQQQYVLATLTGKKHVLLKDIVSTPSKDYSDQLSCAMEHVKFIQFSTMFVHHYHVQTFLNSVRMTLTFGTIVEIDAILTINIGQDLKTLNVTLPLSNEQGCIRRLARFPVLMTTLMLSQQPDQTIMIRPMSAQVIDSIVDDVSGEPISAHCEILFTNHVLLKCYVVYSDAPTRQVLTVKSDRNRYASMTDFVIPHPDGLATYRIYDKVANEQNIHKQDIVRGECIDVPTGPPQNVAMWRNFHQLCRTVDTYGWQKEQPTQNDDGTTSTNNDDTRSDSIRHPQPTNEQEAKSIREALLLTESAIQTKRILIALDESFYNHGTIIHF